MLILYGNMELEKLDLKDHLIKLGMPILQEIIGVDELKAISKITNNCAFNQKSLQQ